MAISTVGFAEGIGGTITKPTGAASGDVGVVLITSFGGAASHTGASGWTLVPGTNITPTGIRHSGWTRVFDGSEGSSFSFSIPDSFAWSIALYRGCDTTTPVNATATASQSSGSSLSSGNITTTVNGCQLLALCSSNGGSITIPSGFTGRSDPDGGDSILADAVQTTATTDSITMSVGGQSAITYLALAPTGGGGGPATAVAKRWDGSAWQTAVVKRWDGSAWQTAAVKRY